MGTTMRKKTAKSHIQNRDLIRRDPDQDRALARVHPHDHVPARRPDPRVRNLVLPGRGPRHGRVPDRDLPRRDLRLSTTMKKAVRVRANGLGIDRGHRRNLPAKRSRSTTPARVRLLQNHHQSTKRVATRNTTAGGMTETDVTAGTSTEAIETARQSPTGIGIEIGTGTAIAIVNEPGTKVATIGTTTGRTIAVPTEMGINGTSTVAVATDTLAVTIDIDLLSTGTGIGIVEDKLGVAVVLGRVFFFYLSYGYAIFRQNFAYVLFIL